MTTIPTTLLIIGSIIFFMFGGMIGVIIMALMSIVKEADRHIGADEENKQ